MPDPDEVDVLILGAGAAGLMCGIEAGRRGRRTLILEHADRPGKKILISGGGRCNFTNRYAAPDNFISANPHFAKSALARYTPQDFLALVEKHGIPWHEKTLGQLFCDRSAHDILNMLLRECAEAKARIQLGTRTLSVMREGEQFYVETTGGTLRTASLVVATGGLSIPKMGATAFGYELARQFGHAIVETRPGLVPLVLNAEDRAKWCDLAGISTEVVASIAGGSDGQIRAKRRGERSSFREKMLVTHRGLSGPAILQISSYWRPGDAIELNLAPELEMASGDSTELGVFAQMTRPGVPRDLAAAGHALRAVLPARLADCWLEQHAPADRPGAASLSNKALAELARQMHAWRITPAGTEGYAKAEVTAGGVDTNSLDARTMESRIVPRLYFIGEVVDVTGWLGGYNFQWAWASGVAAGRFA